MNIELLYFDGCPSWQKGLENFRAALDAEQINGEIRLVRMDSDESAAREKFLGSPSFRINGRELWPEERQDYFLGCRVYQTDAGLRGFPSIAMLRSKIQEILPG